MEWLRDWWPVLVGIGMAMIGTLKFLFAHGRVHAAIERRLDEGKLHFDRNDEDHERIERKLDTLGIGVRELLVHEGLRQAGQGINGEE